MVVGGSGTVVVRIGSVVEERNGQHAYVGCSVAAVDDDTPVSEQIAVVQ